LLGVRDDQGTKLPVGPTFAFALRDGAAFFGWLRFECDDMKDQFVQVFVAAGGQDAHPAAHPSFHVFGPHRKMANGHPQQSRAGQVLESRRGFLATFAIGDGGFGALFAAVVVHAQDATIDGSQFNAGTLNDRIVQVQLIEGHSFSRC
jgi:hypothetical protein